MSCANQNTKHPQIAVQSDVNCNHEMAPSATALQTVQIRNEGIMGGLLKLKCKCPAGGPLSFGGAYEWTDTFSIPGNNPRSGSAPVVVRTRQVRNDAQFAVGTESIKVHVTFFCEETDVAEKAGPTVLQINCID